MQDYLISRDREASILVEKDPDAASADSARHSRQRQRSNAQFIGSNSLSGRPEVRRCEYPCKEKGCPHCRAPSLPLARKN
jgi:hypothetical protein